VVGAGARSGVARLAVWTHFRRPQSAIWERDALRRSDEERDALRRLRDSLSPVVSMCSSYIEQFPEGRAPSTLQIRPRKVASRLAAVRVVWLDEESRIESERVREAYQDVGVDELLGEIPETETPSTDYEALVPRSRGSAPLFRR
jgi:hypothetical protein